MAKHRPWAATLLAAAMTCLPLAALAQSPTTSPSPSGGPEASQGIAALPLEGTPWRIASLRDGAELRPAEAALAPWLTLRAGTLSGDTGCGPLRGSYGTMGSAIRIQLLDVPRAARGCGERALVADRAVRESLRRAASFELIPGSDALTEELIVRDPEGADVLRLAVNDIGGLETEDWRLDSYTAEGRTERATTSLPAVLAFRAAGGPGSQRRSAGDVTGSSGCNGIVGKYKRDGRVLELDDLEVTEAACPADLVAQEAVILAVLGAPSIAISLVPDRLILTASPSDQSLELVTSTPLEGSTWLLGSIPGKPRPKAPVTLRLDAGVVSGEGPCGPYVGTYRTDGLFIAFRDLQGTAEGDCPRRDRQRELFSALERAVLLERDQPALGMLDAQGQLVARFKRPGAS